MAFIIESLLLDIGVLTACLAVVTYAYFKYSYTYWKNRNVPYIEPTFPMGNFTDSVLAKKSLGDIFKDLYRSLEGHRFGGTYMIIKPGFFFRDPDLIRHVLVKDFASFHDRGFFMNEEIEPLTGHLFLLSGERWKNLRAKLTPTFTSGKMKMMFQTLVDCANVLEESLQKTASRGEALEVKDILARYSTDVIASCAFGIESNSLKNADSEFRQWGKRFFEPSFIKSVKGVVASTIPKVSEFLRSSIIDKEVSRYFRNMVRETVEYREANGVKRNDFMQLLIHLKNKGTVDGDEETTQQNGHETTEKTSDNVGLSMDNLAAQAFVFFLAGFETSSSTMTFCLYELSVNPDIQERVRSEIRAVLGKHGGKITYDAIMEMHYLGKVIAETLRKYPPLPILNRIVTREYKVPDTDIVLKKGCPTVISILGLHHDPKYYPNPERFDPERFTDVEKSRRHPYVYLPFGEGPRVCIGMRFGLMQTKVGLVSLLSKYRFSVSAKTPVPLVMDPKSFTVSPLGGMWLQLKNCS